MTNRACCLDTLSKSYGVPWSKKEIGGNCGIPGIFIVECYIYIYIRQYNETPKSAYNPMRSVFPSLPF